jgi:D-glycero-D-manno-heptose 1,7-bisphosphate phosphatase
VAVAGLAPERAVVPGPETALWSETDPAPGARRQRPAVFLDKDGTLLFDVPYNADPARMALMPLAAHGCKLLADAGFALVVTSNQDGVARGLFQPEKLAVVEARLRQLLAAEGVALDAVYFCPHHPDGVVPEYAVECACRKPAPGLLLRAAAARGYDLASSWAVGDILHDVEAGRRAGCRTVLVDVGNETEWDLTPRRMPHYIADDMAEAARYIVRASLGDGTGREVARG